MRRLKNNAPDSAPVNLTEKTRAFNPVNNTGRMPRIKNLRVHPRASQESEMTIKPHGGNFDIGAAHFPLPTFYLPAQNG
jgi:hypothetical protein